MHVPGFEAEDSDVSLDIFKYGRREEKAPGHSMFQAAELRLTSGYHQGRRQESG